MRYLHSQHNGHHIRRAGVREGDCRKVGVCSATGLHIKLSLGHVKFKVHVFILFVTLGKVYLSGIIEKGSGEVCVGTIVITKCSLYYV